MKKALRRIFVRTKIVIFADIKYKDVLGNWLQFFPPKLMRYLEIVALDDSLFDDLQQSKGSLSPLISIKKMKWTGNIDDLWIARVKYIREQVKNGFSVVHSDIDAIWLDNIMPDISDRNYDMVFSQGTIWPLDFYKSHGFVACCGLFFIRSTSVTEKFMNDWVHLVEKDGDDQRSLNHLLNRRGVDLSNSVHDYVLDYNGNTILCFNESVSSSLIDGLRFALLPHKDYQRLPEAMRPSKIFHPLSEKNGSHISEVLCRYNLWKEGKIL
ncbi:hypothetical protein RN22_06360 [Grimontia sp. AD028]|uniref:putative nucleotide-diphospho-sugar transferase n=1 Tax=Grimontia sp. AD028 TaxID=1581149 RepID=UPI00061AE135|nr:putative nucleotide-diphospho-sugar transferase [Grimontia sp. AD028]KKD61338.1 hypothetical protein RN22_06360 [Grimontia sp. AD028]